VATEEEKWIAARGGDPEAFGYIFDLHKDRVYRHALHHLSEHADAEDATAVTFLTLWRKRRTVRVVGGSVLPWLLATTTHNARNLHRTRRRYEALLQRLPHEVATSTQDPAEIATAQLDSIARNSALVEAIRSLSDADAMLIALVAIEGYSTDQASAALGISPGAARTRLHRLRRRLAAKLSPSSQGVTQ
jgi:RNA polymerase sigma-70 factor (ECF subfamily)